MESYSHLPQLGNCHLDLSNIQDAQLMKTKPNKGNVYTAGNSCITEGVIESKPTKLLRDPGAFCSCVGKSFPKTTLPKFEDQLLPIDGINFNTAISKVSPVNLELEKFKSEKLNEAEISFHLTHKQEGELSSLLYYHKESFASDKEPLGEIVGYESDIILHIERCYQPLLRRPAYPASPKSREALEIHIKELLDFGVIIKVGHNEEVEITTPVILEWINGKSRIVGDI
ncbi:hypothetical protein O181_057764 [Austropuccinia psidii MF-1]|uniref:Uncharacterized protein n=1 Tax=Austropuccinia psidii MF-1 TaxID=1389203 RepID=A0A9Q3HWZ7_9BASI|nr:hypothetical protein [Austropuccinia psidii MF-1]